MAIISMKALLESGVHFGHRTNKWDPRMKPYIFTERNGIHIIDLQQTVKSINTAYNIVRDKAQQGGTVLFVGTKRQAQETVRDEAARCGMPYVTERWLGGMLTNWHTINQRVQEMERLENLRDSGEIARLTKKEGLLIERDINRLQTRLEGVRHMKRTPDLVFMVDVGREETALHECNLLGIPVIALVDTNCNPQNVDYVIPSNDDAIRAIKLLVAKIADAVLEGKAMRKDDDMGEEELASLPVSKEGTLRKFARMDNEEELGDEDLLGDATLAKLSVPATEEGDESAVKKDEAAVATVTEAVVEEQEKKEEKEVAKTEEAAEVKEVAETSETEEVKENKKEKKKKKETEEVVADEEESTEDKSEKSE
ncbi:MAG: 30S ribosomal protein S2 [Anaerolineales bacterium]